MVISQELIPPSIFTHINPTHELNKKIKIVFYYELLTGFDFLKQQQQYTVHVLAQELEYNTVLRPHLDTQYTWCTWIPSHVPEIIWYRVTLCTYIHTYIHT